MASAPQNNVQGYSLNALSILAPRPIVAKRAPTTRDINFPIGQEWVQPADTSGTPVNGIWFLASVVANSATWVNVSEGSGIFTSLTVNPGPTNLSTVGVGAVTIGNSSNTDLISLVSGSGGVTIVGNGNSIGIGNDTNANTVTVGSNTTTATTDIQGGSGGINIAGAVATPIVIGAAAQTGTITLGVSSATNAVSIANGSGATTTILGSTAGASATTVNAGTGALALVAAGLVSVVPTTPTAAYPTATVTSNARVIKATFTGFTTADSGGTQVYTIVSSLILATSAVLVTVTNLNASTNGAFLTVSGIIQAAGSLVVNTTNNGAGALGSGDNVLITVWVLS